MTGCFEDDEGMDCASGDTIGTGFRLWVLDSEGWSRLPVRVICVVSGDVVGNGTIGLSDLVRMAGALKHPEALTGAYLEAVDVNDDGALSLGDLVTACRMLGQGA